MKLEIARYEDASNLREQRCRDQLFGLRSRARLEAQRTLDRAAEEAAEIVRRAMEERVSIYKEARAAGYNDGGSRWTTLALELSHARRAEIESIEDQCLDLALEIARRVIRAELDLDETRIADIVSSLVEPLRTESEVTVFLSPSDMRLADPISARLTPGQNLRLVSDPSLQRGDCFVECRGVRVDGRIESQLASIGEHLKQTRRSDSIG